MMQKLGPDVATGIKAGQDPRQYETRYGVIEQVPSSKRGKWTIDNTAYFGIDSTTYDSSGGPLQPGACVQMLYDPTYGNVLAMKTVEQGMCSPNRPVLQRPGGSYNAPPSARLQTK